MRRNALPNDLSSAIAGPHYRRKNQSHQYQSLSHTDDDDDDNEEPDEEDDDDEGDDYPQLLLARTIAERTNLISLIHLW